MDGLFDSRRENSDHEVDAAFLVDLGAVLSGVPQDLGWDRPTWTREPSALELEDRGFAKVSVFTMGRALAMIGARLGAAKPAVSCRWKADKREERPEKKAANLGRSWRQDHAAHFVAALPASEQD